ncbi:aminotransferase class III-fold pyridoxal phosphate-dependent enzyme [Castellaniella sp. MT123]|uniref:aspartate aminotransferase family protein n=1 Tax=Castellaniella sp. MT123 TaxID=3140381 RepID=UPI0031F4311F
MTTNTLNRTEPGQRTENVLSAQERELAQVAARYLPGGTFGNLPEQIIIAKGQGSRVWDESGNEYIDYLIGSGPMLIGHGHPDVNAAVNAQLPNGTTFFANNRHGIRLAEAIVDAVPCADKVRFVSSGTEADFYAMRLARAFRKRDKILKFEGGYHGMSDYGLMSLAPTREASFPEPIPDSPGIPKSVREEVVVAPFNDTDLVVRYIREHADELAGVIVEPLQRLVPPRPGFLEALREVTAETGVLLIFDEVVTGFRFSYGGAQQYYGVTPDVCTLGKACGGGFPLAAIAGRADIMDLFDRSAADADRFLVQIGTLSGNPIAAAAGLATLNVLKQPGVYDRLFATGRKLRETLGEMLNRAELPAQILGAEPLFDVIFHRREIRNYRDTISGDAWLTRRFNVLLRERGIFKGDTKYYVCTAHGDREIAQTTDAWASAIDVLCHEMKHRA